jgi:4a-hydroxytetrahydrobiopterin dehydratase
MSAADLANKKCVSCEGGVPALTAEQVRELLPQVPDWLIAADGKRIARKWRVADFAEGLDFFRGSGTSPRPRVTTPTCT